MCDINFEGSLKNVRNSATELDIISSEFLENEDIR